MYLCTGQYGVQRVDKVLDVARVVKHPIDGHRRTWQCHTHGPMFAD